jgi:phage RecT family recombinase
MAPTTTDVKPREYTNLERALWAKTFALDLARFLGSEEAAAAFIAEIFNQARRIPKLHRCTTESIKLNVARIAALKLNPALPNMVQFIPRDLKQPKARDSDKDTYALELTVQYGYAGLRTLVMRSPEVKDCFTKEVCVNDTFEPPVDLVSRPLHRLPPRFHPRGRVEGYFSVIELHNGNWRFLGMSVSEVEAHVKRYVRELGPAWETGRRPDVEDGLTNFDKMALKTCLRMQCNSRDVPLSVEVALALAHEQATDEALSHTAAELQGYDRHGQRPELTTGSGVTMDELLQDLGGVQDKEAVHAAISQATQRPARQAQRAPVSTAQNGPASTVTGEVVPPLARPADARSGARGTRREPAPPPTDETATPPPDLSGPDLFATEEGEAHEKED